MPAYPVGSDTARRTFRALEPIHGMIYFSPFGPTAYAAVGITHQRMGYLASRSAAIGSTEFVVATFFNFNPAIINPALPATGDLSLADVQPPAGTRSTSRCASPGDGPAGPRPVGADPPGARPTGGERPGGDPCSPPTPPEGRTSRTCAVARPDAAARVPGDGHVALLLTAGRDGLGALITHSATGVIAAEALRVSRGWSEPVERRGRPRPRPGLAADGTAGAQ